jgi:uncharacterized protein YutE (UPF0331/DUF86 family)
VLIEHGVLGEDTREALQAMARFRNRLVHMDFDIEDARVWEILTTMLGDFDGFARAIAERFSEN